MSLGEHNWADLDVTIQNINWDALFFYFFISIWLI